MPKNARKTFADIVSDAQHEASGRAQEQPEALPPFTDDGKIVVPSGTHYEYVGKLSPSAAAKAVQSAEAVVAYDGCGCGRYCGFEWFTDERVEPFRHAGSPVIKPNKNLPTGSMSEWRAEDGGVLILLEGAVRWARQLDDA
jgi:hypothetical protein